MYSLNELIISYIFGLVTCASLVALGGWFYVTEDKWLKKRARHINISQLFDRWRKAADARHKKVKTPGFKVRRG
jgi:hypothetical protein